VTLTEMFRSMKRPIPEFAVVPIEGVVVPENGMVDA